MMHALVNCQVVVVLKWWLLLKRVQFTIAT